jgi:hypothetical protein
MAAKQWRERPVENATVAQTSDLGENDDEVLVCQIGGVCGAKCRVVVCWSAALSGGIVLSLAAAERAACPAFQLGCAHDARSALSLWHLLWSSAHRVAGLPGRRRANANACVQSHFSAGNQGTS